MSRRRTRTRSTVAGSRAADRSARGWGAGGDQFDPRAVGTARSLLRRCRQDCRSCPARSRASCRPRCRKSLSIVGGGKVRLTSPRSAPVTSRCSSRCATSVAARSTWRPLTGSADAGRLGAAASALSGTLPSGLVTPVRLTGMTAGETRTVSVDLPSVVYTVPSKHRIVLTVVDDRLRLPERDDARTSTRSPSRTAASPCPTVDGNGRDVRQRRRVADHRPRACACVLALGVSRSNCGAGAASSSRTPTSPTCR